MIAELTEKYELAARVLMRAVEEEYPIGCRVKIELPGRGGLTIDAEVIGYGARHILRYPHEVRVRNIKTGKTRHIDVDPSYGNRVWKDNDKDQATPTRAAKNTENHE